MGRSTWNGGLNPPGLIVERQEVLDGVVEISGRLAGSAGCCPDCGTPSSSCHNRYVRTLSDLPISGAVVKLRLSVRRFRCKQGSCWRKTFSEALAPSLGGVTAGALLAAMDVTCRRAGPRRAAWLPDDEAARGALVEGHPVADRSSRGGRRRPRSVATVIGIDDFAWRRGHSYGSIIVDLERRRVIDLLPDRQRDTVTAWLKANRQVRIICRDRGPGYGTTAAEAAPQTRQVADRWHLFENATAAFLAAVRSELPGLRKARSLETPVDPVTLSKAERIQWEAGVAREAVNAHVLALAAQGISLKAKARTTGNLAAEHSQDRARSAP